MGLDKYKFNPGEKLPAVNVNSIDPDNVVALSPAKLIGGTSVVIANFTALRTGANNGAFKATIDGVQRNVGVDLTSFVASKLEKTSSDFDNRTYSSRKFGQSFTPTTNPYVSTVRIYCKKSTGSPTGNVLVGIYNVTGTTVDWANPVKQVSVPTANFSTSASLVSFTMNQELEANKRYFLGVYCDFVSGNNYGLDVYFHSTSPIAGEFALWPDYSTGGAMRCEINFPAGEALLSKIIQSEIRTETGKNEIVLWNTNHFEIFCDGGAKSSILKLQAPSSGTDISVATYLDLGANATEVAGQGDDYNLIRLGNDNQINAEIRNITPIAEFKTRAIGTTYQNTSKKALIVYAVIDLYSGTTASHYAQIDAFIGPTDTPNINILRARNLINDSTADNTQTYPITFIVPPNYYYKITSTLSTGTATLSLWHEAEL